ncbi:MAG: hypothetical protein HC880_00720 [Bacteroidia bacterium]|nr:hypothetical protein [Bacteroidia bacterium]
MILAQEEYLSKLSPDQRQILMLDALNKYNQKQENFDIYGIFGLKTTVFLMARIMQLDHFQPFLTAVSQDEYLDVFLKDVELQGRFETLDIVVDYAKNFK